MEKTHLAQTITSMVFSLRKKENVKVRQPLQKVMIPVLDKENGRANFSGFGTHQTRSERKRITID